MRVPCPPLSQRSGRANGLFVFVGLVVLGLASGAGLFYWQASKLNPPFDWEETTPDAPPADRLRFWFAKYGGPQLHHALMQGRMSAEQPWLPTHVVQPPPVEGARYEPELWGIDLAGVGPEMASVDALAIDVRLPAPRMLARTQEIPGEIARRIPIYAPGAAAPAADLARERARSFLSPVLTALDRKLPGVELRIHIGS